MVRHDAFLTTAILGVLFHGLVDFDLQIPAVAVLFVPVAALPAQSTRLPSNVEWADADDQRGEA